MEEADAKLYTCFQTTNHLGEHVYTIYSARVSDFLCKKTLSKPVFTLEAVINGLDSMGCGVYGSKIVLAGGVVTLDEDKKYRRGMITYDTNDTAGAQRVSYVDIPPMQGLKIRPLVFELYERLYVLNTSTYVHRRSFEVYYPKQNMWDEMLNPFYTQCSASGGNDIISGRTPYSWFVFGNCVFLSVPGHEPSYYHHARQVSKSFVDSYEYEEPLPFCGMAITYWHPDFSDVVLITYSQDSVQGRRLIYKPSLFGKPKNLFKTVSYKPVGERSSYFADLGRGNFCLTIFDDVSIHIYAFTIQRTLDKKNGALNIRLTHLVDYKYDFSNFSFNGNQIVNFLGCFAPITDARKKRAEEAKLYRPHFLYCEEREDDQDIPLPKTAIPIIERVHSYGDSVDSDSDVEVYG